MTERALAAQRSHQVRIFRKLETLVEYLKGVGIPRFDVDAELRPAQHDHRQAPGSRRRDEGRARGRRLYEMAARDFTHGNLGLRPRGARIFKLHKNKVIKLELLP